MPEEVECTACSQEVGRGPGGLGLISHWKMHRREYFEEHGESPSNEDVREWLDDDRGQREVLVDDSQTMLQDYSVGAFRSKYPTDEG